MKRTLQFLLLSVLASTVAACACSKPYPYEPPPDPECTVDDECLSDEICEAGECIPEPPPPPPDPDCVVDTDCALNEVCENSVCIPEPPPPPDCVLNTDCEVGEFCDNGTCIPEPPPPPDCVVDTDCAENQTCEAPGICVDIPPPPPPECVIDADCDGALVCEAPGICVEPPPCEDNVDCELSSTCEVEEGECEVIDPDAGCVEPQGFWKNNPNDPTWQQLEPIELGGASYTQAEATALMQTASEGDASLILIKQLIAAILNHGAGAGAPQSVIDAFDAGQLWLLLNADADGRLPFGVDTSSTAGQEALALATFLETYNKGLAEGGPPLCE